MIFRLPLLIILFFIGSWLMLWDFIDFLTTGFNDHIWDGSILMNGFPSIFIGFIIVVSVTVLGYKIFK